MQCALAHLILAIEAQFTLISVATQTVEQVGIPDDALKPEVECSNILLRAHQICDKEIGVKHCKDCGKRGPTHINFILDTVKLSLQTISIRSLVGLPLLDWDELEEGSKNVDLLPVYQPQVCMHKYTHE